MIGRTTLVLLAVIGLATAVAAVSAQAKPNRVDDPATTSTKLPSFGLGIRDSGFGSDVTAPLAISRSQQLGIRFARVDVGWSRVAPSGKKKPSGFDPRNPADPMYNWRSTDATVRRLTRAGFTVYICLLLAPEWAERGSAPSDSGAVPGSWRPDPVEFGNFAYAAATRYSGSFLGAVTDGVLPRVSIWQAWNEPNLPMFLAPTSPDLYRQLLNAFYKEVKRVQPDATVAAAGLAPVRSSEPAAFPKQFAMRLLCLRPSNGWFARDRSCRPRAKFDVFSVQPYSLRAGPLQRAAIRGNMFVADVIDVSQMVRAAESKRSVLPSKRKLLWATEFSWFTNPPNASTGDPPALAGVRTLVALHELWRAGVSQVTWFSVSDDSAALIKGGGFYDSAGNPKPTRDALRFPFIVAQRGSKAYTWGSAPLGATAIVSIQRRVGGGYRTVMNLRPRADGLFSVRFRVSDPKRGRFRAVQRDVSSLSMRATAWDR